MNISEENVLSFTGQDYKKIMQEIMETKSSLMPEYTDDTDTDFGNLILTYCAMLFDVLAWKLDYSVNEAIPMLSETIKAMYKHCKWIGYKPKSNTASSATFEITIVNNGTPQVLSKGSQITMPYMVNNSYVLYEVDENVDCSAPVGTAIGETYTIKCTATQGQTVKEELGVSTGKEAQAFYITYYPYVDGSVAIEVRDIENHSEFYYVNENNSFVGTSKVDNVIVLEQIDSTLIKVKFGDGYNGKIPPAESNITAHYRIGGGLIGNRPKGSINVPVFDMPNNFISMVNITDASGGADAEDVSAIKETVEKGRHKVIYSLMRLQDFNNFLAKRTKIEKFYVCKDTIEPSRLFRPIAIYIKPYNAIAFEQDFKTSLLNEMSEYRLLDDEYHIYDVTPVYVQLECKVMTDGLTIKSQLQYSIKYAIKDYIESLNIGGDDEIQDDIVGLYTDDIRNLLRGISGVRRFISMDKLKLKYPIDVHEAAEVSTDVYDITLYRGQLFMVEDVDTDIDVTFID